MEKKVSIQKSQMSNLPSFQKGAKIFLRTKEGKVKLSIKTINRLVAYKQNNLTKLEAGGVLLGRFIENSSNIIIDFVTKPQPTDIRKRNYFKRQSGHQNIINKVWKASKGSCNYLGEWHTHPELYPTPSKIDINSWKKQLKKAKFYNNSLLFVIVGIKEIAIYEGNKINLSIKKLKNYESK